MDKLRISDDTLVENPNARVPVCLVLDTSGSMQGDPISELNDGVGYFFDAIRDDEIAKYSAEIAIVTFGDTSSVLLDFTSIEKQNVPYLAASGSTPMGEAVNMALDMLEKRKNEYSKAGVDYYQPWMVLMTDGEPTDNIESAVNRSASMVQNRKLTVFPIAIGDHANLQVLERFSPKRAPLKLIGLNFRAFFEWLSKSVQAVSSSIPGENVPLPVPHGWAEID